MNKCPIERKFDINVPFEQWAEKTGMYIIYLCSIFHKMFKDIIILENDKKIIAVNIKNEHIGVAKCHPDDKYNKAIGITIAFYRMMGWELPKEAAKTVTKHLTELKKGDKVFGFDRKNTNKPNMEYVDYYRNYIIFWDLEHHLFRPIVPKDGQKFIVLEEN